MERLLWWLGWLGWLGCSGLSGGCQPHAPAATTAMSARDGRRGEAAEDARADPRSLSADTGSSAARARDRASGASGEKEHRFGELPPHTLRRCVVHAGETTRWTRVVKPGASTSAPAPAPTTRLSCSLSSECGARRGQAPQSTDGTVDIACEADRCSCVVTTYVPPEVNRYTFPVDDPCRDVKTLLRESCGG